MNLSRMPAIGKGPAVAMYFPWSWLSIGEHHIPHGNPIRPEKISGTDDHLRAKGIYINQIRLVNRDTAWNKVFPHDDGKEEEECHRQIMN